MVTDVSGWGVRPLWSMIPAGGSGCSEWLTNPGTLVVRLPHLPPLPHSVAGATLCDGTPHVPGMVLPLPRGARGWRLFVTDVSGWGVRLLWSMIPAGGSGYLEWLTNPGTLVVRLPPPPPLPDSVVGATLCDGTPHMPGMALPLPLGC